MLPRWGDDGRGSLAFSLFGVPVRVHLTFALFFIVLMSSGWEAGWALAGTAVFFVSILGHELGHAMAFQTFGVGEPQVVIHGLGGYTLGRHVAGRTRRVLLSVAGPAAGFAVGYAGHLAGTGLHGAAADVAELAWLTGCVWGLGNLLPILPLDGGNVTLEFIPGTRDRQLHWARVVSVGVGATVAALAWYFDDGFIGLLVGWFTLGNVMALWQEAAAAGDRRSRSESSVGRLHQAFTELSPATAVDTEAVAWNVLGAAPAGSRAFPATVLLSALLVQHRHAEAAEVLARLDRDDCAEYVRILVELGPAANQELDRRLAGSPAAIDLDLALVARAFAGDWDAAAALADWDTDGRLEKGWLELVTGWAFHAGAHEAAARLGMSIERRDAAAETSYNVACSLARLGRTDEALAALDRAAGRGWADVRGAERDGDLAQLVGLPGWAPVRERFVANRRRRTREKTEAMRRPTAAALGFVACLVVTVAMIRLLPDDPTVFDFGAAAVTSFGG